MIAQSPYNQALHLAVSDKPHHHEILSPFGEGAVRHSDKLDSYLSLNDAESRKMSEWMLK
jgi:hypothetical protein